MVLPGHPWRQQYRLSISYQPRPHRWGIRQMFFENQFSLATDLDNRWESYQLFFAPVNWRFESGDRVLANVIPQGERLVEPFAITDTVVIAPGAYRLTRYRLEAEFAARRSVSGQLTWRFGPFYGGHLHQLIMTGDWKPSASFIVRVNAERAIGRRPVGNFDISLLGVRVLLNVSPDLNLSSFVQYDTDSRSVGSNTRLRWSFDPAGDLFMVYNHNLRELADRWRRDSNQLLAKVQYAFRY